MASRKGHHRVAILFADIEAYTSIMQKDEALGRRCLEKFQDELENKVAQYNGEIANFYGDGCLATFWDALDALNCGMTLQRSFQLAPTIPVRLGLHIGAAFFQNENAYGDSVNVTSRIESMGVPGSLLVSADMWGAVSSFTSATAVFLGDFQLKNVDQIMKVYAIEAEGLIIPQANQIGGKSKAVYHYEKLPQYPQAFIGREQQIENIKNLLAKPETRLLSLLGPGGIGKTRLAVQLAQEIKNQFKNGACFIPLDSVEEAQLVPQYIGSYLDLTAISNLDWEEHILEFLADKEILLVLDNLEQILLAGSFVSRILGQCPEVKIIATSREVLNLPFEQEYLVDSLAYPAMDQSYTLDALKQFESILLFNQKAQSIRSQFRLDDSIVGPVAKICHLLEGLPLAIELAAARVKLFSPEAIFHRLEKSFDLLRSKSSRYRHQTIFQAIEWSYDLLSSEERASFQIMAIFPGGFTPESLDFFADQVDPLEVIESLLNKSLIRKEREINYMPRFNMLRMIREFGEKQLRDNPKAEDYLKLFAEYFFDFVEENEAQLGGQDQQLWIEIYDAEYENLFKALQYWKKINPQKARLMGARLWRYFLIRGFLKEGHQLLKELIGIGSETDGQQIKLLEAAGTLAQNIGDPQQAKEYFKQALSFWKTQNNIRAVGKTLNSLGWTEWRLGNYKHAISYSENALEIFQQFNEPSGMARSLNNLSWVNLFQGNFEAAASQQKKVLKLNQQLQNGRGVAFSKTNLSWIQEFLEDFDQAFENVQDAIRIFQKLKDQQLTTFSMAIRSSLFIKQNQTGKARRVLEMECLPIFEKIGDVWGMGLSYKLLADACWLEQDLDHCEKWLKLYQQMSSSIQDKFGVAYGFSLNAKLNRQRQKLKEAQQQIEKAIELALEMDSHWLLSELYCEKSELIFFTGDWKNATRFFALARRHRIPQGEAQMKRFIERTQQMVQQLKSNLGEEAFAGYLKTFSFIKKIS